MVVVTGLGATTPLGGDVASTWSAVLAGASGVRRITADWVDSVPVKIAAPAAVDPGEVIGRAQARRMDRCETLALAASREAWADAGTPEVDPWRLGVAVTRGIGGVGPAPRAPPQLPGPAGQPPSPAPLPVVR